MFDNGSEWRGLDIHLHTVKDKEFIYSGKENQFINNYIECLSNANIGVGVITNHNKFDRGEFIALKKKAKKNNIILFPGVELSVKEGGNGIHILIVFDYNQWIENKNKDSINTFLDSVFKSISNRENANTRCNKDLFGVIEELNSYKKDYFICLAHVDQKSGLFKECDNGMIQTLWGNSEVKDKVLGFQKFHNRDNICNFERITNCRIACVEGSDCKNLDEVGKCDKTYVKIGDDSFQSFVMAFKDFDNRIKKEFTKKPITYIKSIKFEGGAFNGNKIKCSKELNTLIGIRGSGKSALLECVRYALNLDVSKNDKEYKEELVEYIMGSGGKIILEANDSRNNEYIISRIYGEEPHVFKNGESVNITSLHVLKNPLYFGQKDLSNTEKGYELLLLNKILGRNNNDDELNDINASIEKFFIELSRIENNIKKRGEIEKNLTAVKLKIDEYKKYNIDQKLKKQSDLNEDKDKVKNLTELVNDYHDDIKNIHNKYINSFNVLTFKDNENKKIITETNVSLINIKETLKKLDDVLSDISKELTAINTNHTKLKNIYTSLEDEFANIKRNIVLNDKNINLEAYIKWCDDQKKYTEEIKNIEKYENMRDDLISKIKQKQYEKNEYLLKKFNEYEKKIKDLNNKNNSLKLKILFKGEKELFKDDLKEKVKGTAISSTKIEDIAENFSDYLDIIVDVYINDGVKIKKILTEGQFVKLKGKLDVEYKNWIFANVKDKIEILYHDKLLEKHSSGQRASALVLFILSQIENDIVIIDQPEDDLDNQIIYNEIIKEIKKQKGEIQFIFATHNPNIPVLGDAEQIISLEYLDEKINVLQGSIDNVNMQEKIIEIMEGGKEAFCKRNEIYNLWEN